MARTRQMSVWARGFWEHPVLSSQPYVPSQWAPSAPQDTSHPRPCQGGKAGKGVQGSDVVLNLPLSTVRQFPHIPTAQNSSFPARKMGLMAPPSQGQ